MSGTDATKQPHKLKSPSSTYPRIFSKQVIDRNATNETIQFLEENTNEFLYNTSTGKTFNYDPKSKWTNIVLN